MAYLGVLLLLVVALVQGKEATDKGRDVTGQGREATGQGSDATVQGREATDQGREAAGQQCRAGPGYQADTASGCDRYLLCRGNSQQGLLFSCPPGTKFQQRTLVCDHARNVQCGEEEGQEGRADPLVQEDQDILGVISGGLVEDQARKKRERVGGPARITHSNTPERKGNRKPTDSPAHETSQYKKKPLNKFKTINLLKKVRTHSNEKESVLPTTIMKTKPPTTNVKLTLGSEKSTLISPVKTKTKSNLLFKHLNIKAPPQQRRWGVKHKLLEHRKPSHNSNPKNKATKKHSLNKHNTQQKNSTSSLRIFPSFTTRRPGKFSDVPAKGALTTAVPRPTPHTTQATRETTTPEDLSTKRNKLIKSEGTVSRIVNKSGEDTASEIKTLNENSEIPNKQSVHSRKRLKAIDNVAKKGKNPSVRSESQLQLHQVKKSHVGFLNNTDTFLPLQITEPFPFHSEKHVKKRKKTKKPVNLHNGAQKPEKAQTENPQKHHNVTTKEPTKAKELIKDQDKGLKVIKLDMLPRKRDKPTVRSHAQQNKHQVAKSHGVFLNKPNSSSPLHHTKLYPFHSERAMRVSKQAKNPGNSVNEAPQPPQTKTPQNESNVISQKPALEEPESVASTAPSLRPLSIQSIRTGDYVEKSSGLESIPFSRVVAVQSRRGHSHFSRLMTFQELLELLTRSQRAVRMIPIPVSSREARYIQSMLKKSVISHVDGGEKEVPESARRQGLFPSLLRREEKEGRRRVSLVTEPQEREGEEIGERKEKVIGDKENVGEDKDEEESRRSEITVTPPGKVKEAPDYQIVYKSERQEIVEDDAENEILTAPSPTKLVVKPRGGPQSNLFNKEKVNKFHQLTKHQETIKEETPQIQFGFQPLEETSYGPVRQTESVKRETQPVSSSLGSRGDRWRQELERLTQERRLEEGAGSLPWGSTDSAMPLSLIPSPSLTSSSHTSSHSPTSSSSLPSSSPSLPSFPPYVPSLSLPSSSPQLPYREELDTLQAPGGHKTAVNHPRRQRKADSFPSSERKSSRQDKSKRLLRTVDTRPYFFIPSNRRSGQVESHSEGGSKGLVARIVTYWGLS